ncbi:acyl-CoA dehydrogenase family protein [Streptomyces sp. NPDC094147]|uniref:acyl-CoA dehydrogenase family protein n=1 Tax=Streptomyces sp. NPDC094147 TaxID=3366057 RepID=UPI00381EB165
MTLRTLEAELTAPHELLVGQSITMAARGAELADQERQLAADTVTALTRAGFPAYFVPRQWGGREGDFASLLTAVAEVGEACASAAWCAGLWAAHSRFGAFLPERGRRDLWGASPDVRIAAGLAPHAARAVRTPRGDWTLSGEWECVSGIDSAHWVLLAATLPEEPGAVRVFAVPYADVEVVDSWHSTGLRGTGSNTVVLAPTSVPGHRSFALADLMAGRTDGDGPRCHSVPAHLVGGLIFCAPALGAARAALHAWSTWAAPKVAAGAAAGGELHRTLARSSAEIDAAALMLAEAVRRADEDPVTRLGVARNQRDASVVIDLLVTAVERLFRTGGLHARDAAGTVQRCWRDVHTVSAHAVLQFEQVATQYAEAALAP